MKASEMINVGLSYAVVVALANLALNLLGYAKPGIALVAAAVVATEVAAWSYQRRTRRLAPFSVRLAVAVLLTVICVIQSVAFQAMWHWMDHPTTTTIVGAVGVFAVPLAIFGELQKRMTRSQG